MASGCMLDSAVDTCIIAESSGQHCCQPLTQGAPGKALRSAQPCVHMITYFYNRQKSLAVISFLVLNNTSEVVLYLVLELWFCIKSLTFWKLRSHHTWIYAWVDIGHMAPTSESPLCYSSLKASNLHHPMHRSDSQNGWFRSTTRQS